VGTEPVHFQGDNSARADLLTPVDASGRAEGPSLPVTLGDTFYNNMPRSHYAVPLGPVTQTSKLPLGVLVAQNAPVVAHLPLAITELTLGELLALEGVRADKFANVSEGVHNANDTLGGAAGVTAVHGKVNNGTGKTETLFQVDNGIDKPLFVNWAGTILPDTEISIENIGKIGDLLRLAGFNNRADFGALGDKVSEAARQFRGGGTVVYTYSPENPGTFVVRRLELVPATQPGLVPPLRPEQKPDFVDVVAEQRIVARVGNELRIFKDWDAYHTAIGAR
jgi:hypothetical protein